MLTQEQLSPAGQYLNETIAKRVYRPDLGDPITITVVTSREAPEPIFRGMREVQQYYDQYCEKYEDSVLTHIIANHYCADNVLVPVFFNEVFLDILYEEHRHFTSFSFGAYGSKTFLSNQHTGMQ